MERERGQEEKVKTERGKGRENDRGREGEREREGGAEREGERGRGGEGEGERERGREGQGERGRGEYLRLRLVFSPSTAASFHAESATRRRIHPPILPRRGRLGAI